MHQLVDDHPAEGDYERALELEPLSLVVQHHVAWIYLLARRYDEAIAVCRSVIDMDATFPMTHLWMGISLEQKGLYDEAIASLDRAVACMGGASIGVAAAAHAYAMAGQTEEARRRLAGLQHPPSGRYVQAYGTALVEAALGDTNEALQSLEQAHRNYEFWWTMWGNVDPRLDGLRDHPRFQALLGRLGFPHSGSR